MKVDFLGIAKTGKSRKFGGGSVNQKSKKDKKVGWMISRRVMRTEVLEARKPLSMRDGRAWVRLGDHLGKEIGLTSLTGLTWVEGGLEDEDEDRAAEDEYDPDPA